MAAYLDIYLRHCSLQPVHATDAMLLQYQRPAKPNLALPGARRDDGVGKPGFV